MDREAVANGPTASMDSVKLEAVVNQVSDYV